MASRRVLSDIGLPGMNGRLMADAAREKRPDLRVLLMTGYAASVAGPDGVLASGMELIIKPFDAQVLAGRIRGMIQGPPRRVPRGSGPAQSR